MSLKVKILTEEGQNAEGSRDSGHSLQGGGATVQLPSGEDGKDGHPQDEVPSVRGGAERSGQQAVDLATVRPSQGDNVPNGKDLPKDSRSGHGLSDRARYDEIARRLLLQQPIGQIASDLGISDRQIRRIMRRPEMQKVFNEVREALFSDIDKLIKDEKLAPLMRVQAQAIRAQTVLQEILDEVQVRVHGGAAKATEMKVGADIAFGIIDRSRNDLAQIQGPRGASGATVNIHLTQEKTALLKDVVAESGVDLSDIIDAEIVGEDSHAGANQ